MFPANIEASEQTGWTFFDKNKGILDPDRMLDWKTLSELYDNDLVLERAGKIFKKAEVISYRKNNERYRTGKELREIFVRDPSYTLCIGKNKGLSNNVLKTYIISCK